MQILRYDVIVIINKYKNDFYFYGRRQGNGCEIQFRGLLWAREVLISRTVAHKSFILSSSLHGRSLLPCTPNTLYLLKNVAI
jgi:hypothetical protein